MPGTSGKTPEKFVQLKLFGVVMSATLGIASWVVLRWPNGGLLSATGPMLAAAGAMSEPLRRGRVNALFRNIFLTGVMEFCRAMAAEEKLMVLPFVFLFTLILHSCIKAPSSAAAVAGAGLVNFHEVPYLEAVEVCIAFAVISVVAALIFLAADIFVLGKNDEIPGDYPPPLSRSDIFRRAAVFTAAYYIAQALNWHEAGWLLITVGVSYLSGYSGAKVARTAVLRYILAPAGLGFGMIFLFSLCCMDWQAAYLAYFSGIIAFYINFREGYYPGFYIFFVVMLLGADNLVAGSGTAYGNGWSMFFHCLISTAVGAGLVAAVEGFRRE